MPGYGRLRVHPRYLVGQQEQILLDAYLRWKGGGMGPGQMPYSGGTLEQPAALMQAFHALHSTYEALKPRGPGGAG